MTVFLAKKANCIKHSSLLHSKLLGIIILCSLASMPTFMQNADRIVGGQAAPSMIPWQVAMLSGSIQFCGGTILDSCTILTAAHCGINTGHRIRAGSLDKTSGGQVRTLEN